jgi:PHD/YefM family antitoxin component YafN of YafNO toxin-antitoxin module
MKLSTQIKPLSYLKEHTEEIVKTICANREPLLITQNDVAKLVILDVKTYENWEQSLVLLKLLALGNREIEQGKFRDAKAVFAELEEAET